LGELGAVHPEMADPHEACGGWLQSHQPSVRFALVVDDFEPEEIKHLIA